MRLGIKRNLKVRQEVKKMKGSLVPQEVKKRVKESLDQQEVNYHPNKSKKLTGKKRRQGAQLRREKLNRRNEVCISFFTHSSKVNS